MVEYKTKQHIIMDGDSIVCCWVDQIVVTCQVASVLADSANKVHLKLSQHTGSDTFRTTFVVSRIKINHKPSRFTLH